MKTNAAGKREDRTVEYDSAYTNFGAHLDVHRWACVGLLEDIQAYVIGPGKTATTDQNGWNCLHWACYAGRTDIIKLLHSQGNVGLDATTKFGDTALHVVSRQNNVEVFQLLLDMGANARIKNDRGKLPYQLSRGESAGLLRALSAAINPTENTEASAVPKLETRTTGAQPEKMRVGSELVGKWIAVEYEEEPDHIDARKTSRSWYRAQVQSFDSNKLRHRVIWEDGTKDWIVGLKADEYKISSAPSESKQQQSTPFAGVSAKDAGRPALTALKTSSGEAEPSCFAVHPRISHAACSLHHCRRRLDCR
jgi:hypothetical protein